MTADDPAMRPDIDLQDDGILGAREVVEGLAAPRTTTRIGGKDNVLDDDWEVGIVTPFWPWLARLLTSGPTRWCLGRVCERGRRFGRGGRFCLSTEELLLAEANEGLQPLVLGLEFGLAFEGAAMHALPRGGLSPGLKLLLQSRANRTRALRNGRSRADGAGRRIGLR
jgi:hypothetical protein